MKQDQQKHVLKWTIVIVVCSVLVGILVLISPIIAILNEDFVLKEQLDNRYINSDFCDWRSTYVKDYGSILLPEEWLCTSDSELIHISDKTGEEIAIGGFIGKDAGMFADEAELLNSIGETVRDDVYREIAPVEIYGSNFGKLCISESAIPEYYYIALTERESFPLKIELVFVFQKSFFETENDFFEIAQAIVYSYCFGNERNNT